MELLTQLSFSSFFSFSLPLVYAETLRWGLAIRPAGAQGTFQIPSDLLQEAIRSGVEKRHLVWPVKKQQV
jgi:hypothetical protein